MNRVAPSDIKGIDVRQNATPELITVPRPPGYQRAKYYQPLVETLLEIRRKNSGGVVSAFTSVSPDEGVPQMVETLAWELALEGPERILLTTPAAFWHAAASGIRAAGPLLQDQIYRLGDPGTQPALRARNDGLQELRLRFGFVLVDCPPVSSSSAAHSFFKMTDHAVLIVRAGKTTYREIEWARKALRSVSANLLGLVLNQSTE